MGFLGIFGDEPALDGAIGDGVGQFHHGALGNGVGPGILDGAGPEFWCNGRGAAAHHRGRGRHRVTGHDLDVATISLFQDRRMNMRQGCSGGPGHLGDVDGAIGTALGGICILGKGGKAAGRQKGNSHRGGNATGFQNHQVNSCGCGCRGP